MKGGHFFPEENPEDTATLHQPVSRIVSSYLRDGLRYVENAKRFAANSGKTKPDGRRIELEAWSSWPEFCAESRRAFARRVDDGYERGARTGPYGSVPGPTRVALPPIPIER
jgi:hypothetical protein